LEGCGGGYQLNSNPNTIVGESEVFGIGQCPKLLFLRVETHDISCLLIATDPKIGDSAWPMVLLYTVR